MIPLQRIANDDGTVTWRTVPDPRTRAAHREVGRVFYGGFIELTEPPAPVFPPPRCAPLKLKDTPVK